ncbi:class I SAM-dependent methyltransferase [Coprobacter tertius]|uniref:Class I SAM-dependent methyltransferase n=1 Tax=Coprobacter tertius TaxID=2944915 RepID=A0ABT1MMF8_9BACT|nr:class I SAM-dependent methyltransferase [Coprobacter tertius]MCP9612938.1 class I SAM-dependent methyltransferase [Coprobacter tertius]
MKVRNPIDRDDLKIKKKDKVLEVGSGHNPTFRSDVVVDKYIDSNYHRSDNIMIYPHQAFINADGANMPFKDKEFDYVICNQVIEHVDDPLLFVKELQRVAKRGYIELPSLIGESLFPKKSHKWVCLEIDNKLVFYEKDKLPKLYPDYGRTFLNFLPYQSLALRVFHLSYHQSDFIKYEWKDTIDIIVNSEDPYYKNYFLEPWSEEMSQKIFPVRSLFCDVRIFIKVTTHLIKGMINRRLHSQSPISLEEYKSMRK